MKMKESGTRVPEIELVNERLLLVFPQWKHLPLLARWWKECPTAQIYFDRERPLLTRGQFKESMRRTIPMREFGQTPNENSASLIPLMILTRKEETPIGIIVLHDIDWTKGEGATRTFISEAFQGLEYGTDAKMLLLRFAFMELGFSKIHSWTRQAQPAVMHFNLKCGMRIAGRTTVTRKGELIKLMHFTITEDEFNEAWMKHEIRRPHRHSSYRIQQHEGSL